MRTDGDADLLAAVNGDADDAARHDSYLGAILSRVREGNTDDDPAPRSSLSTNQNVALERYSTGLTMSSPWGCGSPTKNDSLLAAMSFASRSVSVVLAFANCSWSVDCHL